MLCIIAICIMNNRMLCSIHCRKEEILKVQQQNYTSLIVFSSPMWNHDVCTLTNHNERFLCILAIRITKTKT